METAGTTIKHLYPEFDDQQLKEAEENLELYLQLVMRIHERMRGEQFEQSSRLGF
jgi:predicted XRE-type DNA-binding protein